MQEKALPLKALGMITVCRQDLSRVVTFADIFASLTFLLNSSIKIINLYIKGIIFLF